MPGKKLFFGVSAEDLEKEIRTKEQKEAAERVAKEAAEAAQKKYNEAEHRKNLYKRYGIAFTSNSFFKNYVLFGGFNTIAASALVLMAASIAHAPGSRETSNPDVTRWNPYSKPFKVVLHDVYIPTNKYYDYKYCENSDCDNIKVHENPEFKPHVAWCLNVFITLCALIYSIIFVKMNRYGRDAVDMMIDLKKFGEQYNLNTEKVKKLVNIANYTIERMSADERVYFDMLMNDNINIADKDTMKQFATTIMVGHLEKHPRDIEKIMKIFDERTIPKVVLDKMSSISR